MATIQEAIKRLVYQFSSQGADKVAADLNKVGDAYSAAAQKATGITSELTNESAKLVAQIASIKKNTEEINASIYTEDVLRRMKAAAEFQQQIALAAKAAANLPGGATAQWQNPFIQETNRSAGIEPRTFPQGGDPVVDSGAIDAAKKATDGLAQAQRDATDAAIRMAKESSNLVSALGSSATAAEKEQARIDALTVSYNNGAISVETYNRAVAANPAVYAAQQTYATSKRSDQG